MRINGDVVAMCFFGAVVVFWFACVILIGVFHIGV